MALKSVVGVDHIVVAVRDLDKAAAAWSALGFTMSPRGTHSSHLGTGNYTTMFGDDYVELLGVLHDTDQNLATREFLMRREGIERTAFTAIDAEAGAAELRSRGLEPLGPVHFNRPVSLPDGSVDEARFSVFRWPLAEAPGGMRIFACQHHTRHTVWIPSIQRHANGVSRIVRIEILDQAPEAAAQHMSRLIDQPVVKETDGAFRVPSGGTRADFVYLDHATLSGRYPAAAIAGLPAQGAVGLVLATPDAGAAARAIGPKAMAEPSRTIAPASLATGVVVSFVQS
jgi:catechol 2,3-dioxygenase-like lactoylglutathione lyase family enzyme